MYIRWDFSGFDKKCLNIFNWKINVFSKIAQMAVYFFFFLLSIKGGGLVGKGSNWKIPIFFFLNLPLMNVSCTLFSAVLRHQHFALDCYWLILMKPCIRINLRVSLHNTSHWNHTDPLFWYMISSILVSTSE